MFIVYQTNKINLTLLKICEIIKKKPLLNIFEKEIFIHDNKVLFQYLNIFIANEIGISANFKFYHPNNFIFKLFKKISSEKEVKNLFTQPIMTWKIMKFLNKKNFEFINQDKNKIQQFKFSFLMSSIFEEYLLYRPDLINSWENKKNKSIINDYEKWQIKIWKEITYDTKQKNVLNNQTSNLLYAFQSLINEKKIKKHLPSRLFIFSSFTLTSSYMKIFQKISQYIDIYFLHCTPCKNNISNFNNIQNNKFVSKYEKQKNVIYNNSLMQLWGEYEKFYTLYIVNSNKIIDCFKKDKHDSLLNNIKKDLFEYNLLNIENKKKIFLDPTDNSVSINIFYDKKNEIEVLHDKILSFFYNDPSIMPSDIVVTSFSINSYIPFINLIFKLKNNGKIPFFICKKHSKKTEIILSSFKKILNLSNSRFKNQEILELLDVREISNNFNISEEEINILYNWIEEANIRWAINSNHKDYLLFPKNKQNTWFYGIEKLLLSYAINDTENIWNNILSCSLINGSRGELIGKLSMFINTLKKWQKKMSIPQNIKHWRSLSNDIINDFFCKNKKIEEPIDIIEKNWMKMIDNISLSNYKNKISIELLKKNFFYKKNHPTSKKFLPGVINFCHPSVICYIPFKITCIIGANNQNFLNKSYLDNFNLLTKKPLIGDINIYQQYSYFFLQSIASSQKHFYISYIGYSDKDHSKMYPLIFIDQLLNYIVYNFCFIGDKDLTIKDNRKKIIQHLCKKYEKKYFYDIKKISSIKNASQYKNIKTYKIFSCEEKSSYNKINLTDLICFWKHPIRYFCNFSLKIKFNVKQQEMNTTEPFSVNMLDSFEIKTKLLNKLIKNKSTEKLFEYYMLSGKLPYGFFGKFFWNQTIKDIKSIANLVIQNRISTKEKKIILNIKKYQIHGTLSEIQNTGLLRWKPNVINYSDRISLWIEHLIYSAALGVGESKIIGYNNQIWSFSSLNPDVAHNYLLEYIEGYIKGIKNPILLTKSGASWLDQIYDLKKNIIKKDKETKIKSHKKLLNNWMGSNYIKGEKEDFYIHKIIPELNQNYVDEICKTAEKWLIPILKNKKK